jgi:hypothetical protein
MNRRILIISLIMSLAFAIGAGVRITQNPPKGLFTPAESDRYADELADITDKLSYLGAEEGHLPTTAVAIRSCEGMSISFYGKNFYRRWIATDRIVAHIDKSFAITVSLTQQENSQLLSSEDAAEFKAQLQNELIYRTQGHERR